MTEYNKISDRQCRKKGSNGTVRKPYSVIDFLGFNFEHRLPLNDKETLVFNSIKEGFCVTLFIECHLLINWVQLLFGNLVKIG